jgi:hypothetical protein
MECSRLFFKTGQLSFDRDSRADEHGGVATARRLPENFLRQFPIAASGSGIWVSCGKAELFAGNRSAI